VARLNLIRSPVVLTFVGSMGVVLLLVLAPLASGSYSSTGWTSSSVANVAGTVSGSGSVSITLGEPTFTAVGVSMVFTAGISAKSGALTGAANIFQRALTTASPTFKAWKASTAAYDATVNVTSILAAGDFTATTSCGNPGGANASAIVWLEIELYDGTTGTVSSNTAFPFTPGPWFSSCSGGIGGGTVSSHALNATGSLTVTGLTLTRGNTYQVEVRLLAVASADVSSGGSASATITFPKTPVPNSITLDTAAVY